jgi:hypothetical protein
MDLNWSYWLGTLVAVFPNLIAYLIGVIVALIQFRAFPRVAVLVGVAFGGLLLLLMVQVVVYPFILKAITENSSSMTYEARKLVTSGVAALFFSLPHALAMGLLCYAAFTGRRAAAAVTSPSWR